MHNYYLKCLNIKIWYKKMSLILVYTKYTYCNNMSIDSSL